MLIHLFQSSDSFTFLLKQRRCFVLELNHVNIDVINGIFLLIFNVVQCFIYLFEARSNAIHLS